LFKIYCFILNVEKTYFAILYGLSTEKNVFILRSPYLFAPAVPVLAISRKEVSHCKILKWRSTLKLTLFFFVIFPRRKASAFLHALKHLRWVGPLLSLLLLLLLLLLSNAYQVGKCRETYKFGVDALTNNRGENFVKHLEQSTNCRFRHVTF